MPKTDPPAGLFPLADRKVNRMGYGAMQLAGPGVFGPPKDRGEAIAVLREAVASGVDHIDTSDFYGPYVTNQIIREALQPYPDDLTIVTKVGAVRGQDGSWNPAQAPDDLKRGEATLGVRELLRFEADRAWKLYEEGSDLYALIAEDSQATLWLLVHTYSSLLARIESVDFAVFNGRVGLTKTEKLKLVAKARFGRHTKANIVAKCDRDRGRARGAVGGHRAS